MTLENERGDWVETFSGLRFYALDPRENEISIIDIAHSQSLMCRFNGQSKFFYSIASHSIVVKKLLEYMNAPLIVQLQGLLHDASEAYICDIPTPIKGALTNYHDIEAKIMDVIFKKYNIPNRWNHNFLVKKCDYLSLLLEANILMPNHTGWADRDTAISDNLWNYGNGLIMDRLGKKHDETETEFLEIFNTLSVSLMNGR